MITHILGHLGIRSRGDIDDGRRLGECEETFGCKVMVLGVQHHPNRSHQALPDVVMTVSLTIWETEEITHPHGHLGGDP